MISAHKKPVVDLLVESLSRDMLMGIEEAFLIGAERGYAHAKGMNRGHLPNVLGQMRHFHMNETFWEALAAGGANPTPLKGNRVVVGRAGMFNLARFNVSAGLWNNSRRSQTRRALAEANRAIEQLVQPNLFDATPVTQGTVFFVACFSGSLSVQPEAPQSVHLAVPDKNMKSWLFQEPISQFLERYYESPAQADNAMPKLKPGVQELGRTDR